MKYPLTIAGLAALTAVNLWFVPNIWNAACLGFVCGCGVSSFMWTLAFRDFAKRHH
jgi:hypothetical protein